MKELRDSFLEIEGEIYSNKYIKRIFMVEMSDGIKLETIAFLPDKVSEKQYPALLTRTPYEGMREYQDILGEEFAKRGIAFVYQFCRGIANSEGIWIPNENERQDSIDTLHWLDGQSWCRAIGLHGSSYMALTAWVCADSLPKKVVGMFVSHYGVDRYASAYESGLFRHDILTGWTLFNLGTKVDDFKNQYMKAAKYRPHIDADVNVFGRELPWYRTWITETDKDSTYWQSGFWHMLMRMPSKINVPVCIYAGWFDHHLKGTLRAYELLNEDIKEKSSIRVGGWNHSFEMTVGAHPQSNGSINMQKALYDWFKPLFKGERAIDMSKYYLIGEDKWIEDDFVKNRSRNELELFFTNEQQGKKRLLSRSQSNHDYMIEYDYDPENPVQSIGGETLFVSRDIVGCQKQPQCGYRDDVISFITIPFDKDIDILGKIKVSLVVESDCDDSCFTVKVIDTFENGDAYNIRNGLTTLAYKNGATSRGTYVAGDQIRLDIETLPVAWTLKKGHKLRVDLSSSNFPEYAIHSNFPGVWSMRDEIKKAHQKIYVGKHANSKVIIPLRTEETEH